MSVNKITEKTVSNELKPDSHVLVTQNETVNGSEVHSLRRVPIESFQALTSPGLIRCDSGDPAAVASFTDGAENLPMSLKVAINPAQEGSGTPSPSNPRALVGYESMDIYRSGRNLFHPAFPARQSTQTYTYYFKLKPNTYYTCSSNVPQGSPANVYFAGGDTSANGVYNGGPKTFQTGSDGKIALSLRYVTSVSGTNLVNAYAGISDGTYWLQLEEGSSATPHQPMLGEAVSISFPSAAGTVYGGTLEIDKSGAGTLTIDYCYAKGGWTFSRNAGTGFKSYTQTFPYFGRYANTGKPDAGSPTTAQSNITASFGSYTPATAQENKIQLPSNGTKAAFMCLDETFDPDDVEVAYVMLEPIVLSFTAAQVKTLLGVNNVWTDTGETQVTEYTADAKTYIDNKIAELQAMVLENNG